MKTSELKTGDIILFSSSDSILDRAIQYFTSSTYTHVGIIIKDPPGYPPGLHMLESNLESSKDEISDKWVLGVQLQPLWVPLMTNGVAYCRKLHINVDVDASYSDITAKILTIAKLIDTTPYDINPLDWLLAELRILMPDTIWKQQDHSFWCSALVAYIYVKLDLLPSTLPWTLISPKEWSLESTTLNKDKISALPFKNCTLGSVEKLF